MKRAILFVSLMMLTGCAGLQTDWVLRVQMQYSTPSDKPAATAPEASQGKPA